MTFRLVAFLASAAAWAAPLRAQEPARDTAQHLPPLEVTVSVLPRAGAATGSGIPARAAIIDASALLRHAPRTLAHALSTQPGVALYDDLGSAYKPTVVVRGFTASGVVGLPQGVSVFIDGVPVNEPDAGQVNFDLLPLRHVRHVELFSGTASLLGPNSLAGTLNLVTNRGGGPGRGEVALGLGSHGSRSASARAEGAARGWSYYTGAELAREEGWRQLTSAALGNVLVNVGRFTDRHGLGLQVSAASSRAETAGSLPQSVYAVRPDSNLSAGDFEDLRQLHVAVAGYRALPIGDVAGTLYGRAHDAERFNVNQVDDPDVRAFSRNRTMGAQAEWSHSIPLPSAAVAIRAGAGGSFHRADIRLFAERIDPGLTTDVRSPIRKADAYLLGQYARGRVTLAGGARYDIVQIPFRNLLRPVRDTTSTYGNLSPRAGVTVRMGNGVQLFASTGRGFRAPAVIELACADAQEPCPLPFALGDDPPLAPVVATTIESGMRWIGSRWVFDAAMYRTYVQDDIFLFPYVDEAEPSGSTIDGYFANVPRTRREGVEMSGSVQAAGAHQLRASYGLSRATFQSTAGIFSIREAAGEENEVEPGDRLPLVPDHTATLGATLQLRRELSAGMEARYVGRRWLRGDEANETSPLAPYTLLDLYASFERARWSVESAVTNALGRRYSAFGTFNINQGAGDVLERFLTPGSRREARITVRRAFGG